MEDIAKKIGMIIALSFVMVIIYNIAIRTGLAIGYYLKRKFHKR